MISTTNGQTYPRGYGYAELQRLGEQHHIWGETNQRFLSRAGFDRTKKTLFLWQSVSLFLEADTVQETLRRMADLCGDGSVIAQDFYSRAFISGETSKTVGRSSRMFEKMGEPWRFGLDMSNGPRKAVESFLEECGLQMTAFFQFGEKRNIEPFYYIVEAVKKQ